MSYKMRLCFLPTEIYGLNIYFTQSFRFNLNSIELTYYLIYIFSELIHKILEANCTSIRTMKVQMSIL